MGIIERGGEVWRSLKGGEERKERGIERGMERIETSVEKMEWR